MALKRGDERELAFITFAPVGHDSHGPAVPLRDEAGKREDVDRLATPSLESSAKLVVHKRLGPATIRLLVLPNHHGAQATPRLDRARFLSEPRNSVDQRHIRERVSHFRQNATATNLEREHGRPARLELRAGALTKPLSLASVCASVEAWSEVLRQRDRGGQTR